MIYVVPFRHSIYLIILCTITLSSCSILSKAETESINHYQIDQRDSLIAMANNDSSGLEVVFIDPNSRNIQIGQFEKLELGVRLPSSIEQMIDKFLNDSTFDFLNPYDPDQISMEAVFIHEKDTFKTFGFYYNDYRRDLKTNNTWKEVYTDYHWRIRFAPPLIGDWIFNLNIIFPNQKIEPITKTNIQFVCIDRAKKGFIEVAYDKRHFQYADTKTTFFPIGQNIPWTDEPIFKGHWLNANENGFYSENPNFKNKLYNIGFIDFNKFVENVADNNGNMIRTISWHNSFQFEWEEKGVFGSNRHPKDDHYLRQKRSWELDQLFETAESKDLKILFCLEFQGQHCYDWNGGNQDSYYHNPYNHVEKDGNSIPVLPQDFFSDFSLIKDYKKKLRYFMARWGYSPSLGIFQLLNEFDGWSVDSNKVSEKMHDIIKTDGKLQKNIQLWHNEIGTYIHNLTHRPIIVTSGLMGNTKPTDIPFGRNLYNTDGMDIVIWNKYGNDRSINYEMYQSAQAAINTFNKPFLYTETGLITNPAKNADPGDLEACDDVMFHNFSWAGSVMGSAGGSLTWWQAFDNKRRENYKAMHSFFQTIPFDSIDYVANNRWNDGGTSLYICGNIRKLLNKKSFIEVYYVKSKLSKKEPQSGFGWAHNLTNYWANLSSYMNCPDRHNHLAKNNSCSDDIYSEPVVLNESEHYLKLKGLQPNKAYQIEWYTTRGEGGLFKSIELRSNGAGNIQLYWPGTDFDYAFKFSEIPTISKR